MDLKFGFSGAQQSCDIPAPLVNLLARGFDVGLALAGADDELFLLAARFCLLAHKSVRCFHAGNFLFLRPL
jgi:hypothetical protein